MELKKLKFKMLMDQLQYKEKLRIKMELKQLRKRLLM